MKVINLTRLYPVTSSIVIAAILLFICSSVRHWLYQSHAFDLGWFDQAVYLIASGQKPIVSFGGFHILGDHAAVIFYPLALLYYIYPDVHWLFAIQSLALTIAGFPIYYLALQARLDRRIATTLVFAYLLYPLVFNKNLYDFHPEVIAVPGFLIAILAARSHNIILFSTILVLILSCKSVLSLTVIAMGIWLILFEKRSVCGAIAISTGLAWFMISTQLIIPLFSGAEAAAISRYSYLGNSVLEIARNIIIKPNLILGKIFSTDTLEYVAFLILPIIWGLSPKHLAPLISAIPMLLLNILSTASTQRNLIHQYSLPILPFLFIAIISAISDNQGFLKTRRNILIWSFLSFIAFSKIGYFWSTYLSSLDNNQAVTTAITQINDRAAVLTTGEIAPHLTHRPIVQLTFNGTESIEIQQFKYILLNQRHPGWNSNADLIKKLKLRTEDSKLFDLKYNRDEIYLFVKK
jgi:uncharacterized membrane protein